MCDDSRTASLYRARKKDLLQMRLENEDYMDEEGARVRKHDIHTPMLPRKLAIAAIARAAERGSE